MSNFNKFSDWLVSQEVFLYTPEIHEQINFGNDPISNLLSNALGFYANKKVAKAMHDPLAMLFMLYPDIGNRQPISMSFKVDKKHHVFSSIEGNSDSFTFGLIEYNSNKAWDYFKKLYSNNLSYQLKI